MNSEELDDLIGAYLSGALDEPALRKLDEVLKQDPAAGRRLAELSLQDCLLTDLRHTEGSAAASLARVTKSPESRVTSPEPETESHESQVVGHESTAVGLDSQSERSKPVTRKTGAAPFAAPQAGPATRDSGLATRDSVSPARDSDPEIHYGTGIHKFVKENGRARVGSSQRLRALRRKRPASFERPLWPLYLAAAVMAAVSLWLALGRGGGLTHVAPPVARQEPKAREAFERNRLAQEELARRDEAARQAREKAARAEAERKKVQEQLAELERRKQELEAAAQAGPSPLVTEVQKQEAEEARRQELARIDAQQKTEGARLAQAEVHSRQAEEDLAHKELARKEAEQNLAATRRKAEELGRVVFVVELKKEETPGTGVPPVSTASVPVLVRGKGADATRFPLTKDLPILAGDRIEIPRLTPLPASGEGQGVGSRPVHAALELSNGATVDLADGTSFEVTGAAEAKLNEGLLFAEVSGFSAGGAGDPKGAAAGKWVVRTPFAHAEMEHANFDLSADASRALLQVVEGEAFFANEVSRRKAGAMQQVSALKNGNLVQKELSPAEVWGGRKGTLHLGLVSHWTFDEGKGEVAADASGHGNQGTPIGAPVWTEGRLGGALLFDGAKDYLATTTASAGPQVFTLALWFRTATASGGKLIGFGDTQTGKSGSYDRHLYMANSGELYFGVSSSKDGRYDLKSLTSKTIRTLGACNDGKWHHVAASLSSAGMVLFLDGRPAASDSTVTSAWKYRAGYWKAGTDMGPRPNMGWPGQSANHYYKGSLDEVRIYDRALSAGEIATLAEAASFIPKR